VPTEPLAPMPSDRCGASRIGPAVDTLAVTHVPGAGQGRQWQQPAPVFVRSPVSVRHSSTSEGASRGQTAVQGCPPHHADDCWMTVSDSLCQRNVGFGAAVALVGLAPAAVFTER
jgi:hypothetical protein